MNPMRMFWGIVLAGLGVLLLGAELGWWDHRVWVNLLFLWPVILIVIGLRLLIKDEVIFSILMIAVLAIAGYLAVTGTTTRFGRYFQGFDQREVVSENLSEKYESSAKRATVDINLGATQVELSALEDEESKETLFTVSTRDYGKLSLEKDVKGDTVNLKVNEDLERGFFFGPMNRRREFDGKLTNILPLDLEINSGASNFNFDFSKLKLENFDLNTGASNGDITFGKNVSLLTAKVKTGASKITVRVPKGVGLKLKFDKNALNNRDFAPGLSLNQESDNRYVSKDYDAATNKIDLDVDAGVSNIQVIEY